MQSGRVLVRHYEIITHRLPPTPGTTQAHAVKRVKTYTHARARCILFFSTITTLQLPTEHPPTECWERELKSVLL